MESKCGYNQNKTPRVVVLMSSYNGEKYIREQIESILWQSYRNVKLYVRDDGSTDGTLDILKKYAEKGELVLYEGENLGYVQSFFELLRLCEDAPYYLWCDQDDVWEKGKLERAVQILEKNQSERPCLYFSDYDYYDEKMNFQKHGLDHKRGPSFANSLLDCIPLGFCSVFNSAARKMMTNKIPEHCCGHDWWTYMVCAAFGQVIYDRGYFSVQYRRLEQSVSPGGTNFLALQMWRFKKFFLNNYFIKIREQHREFASIYGNNLNEKDKKIMCLFAGEKFSIPIMVKKLFYPVWFRQSAGEELMVRALFLLGKL